MPKTYHFKNKIPPYFCLKSINLILVSSFGEGRFHFNRERTLSLLLVWEGKRVIKQLCNGRQILNLTIFIPKY